MQYIKEKIVPLAGKLQVLIKDKNSVVNVAIITQINNDHAVIAYLEATHVKECGVLQVTASVAAKTFGSALYAFAMMYANSKDQALTCDAGDSMSSKAHKLWRKIHEDETVTRIKYRSASSDIPGGFLSADDPEGDRLADCIPYLHNAYTTEVDVLFNQLLKQGNNLQLSDAQVERLMLSGTEEFAKEVMAGGQGSGVGVNGALALISNS